jgi:hypothetical protein
MAYKDPEVQREYQRLKAVKRRAAKITKVCERCSFGFSGTKGTRFCSSCLRSVFRETRQKQLAHEQNEAAKLEKNGYKVYSPTVVCDRVAIKDGKVYFVEFKQSGQSLRAGQKAIQELVPEMYIIQFS